MEERKEINLHDNFQELLMKMSEGNPGGLSVLMQIAKEFSKCPEDAFIHMMLLDDMNIRGSQIWMGYKDYCGSDIKKFIQCIKEKNQGMINKINEESRKSGIPWVAVEAGASVPGKRQRNHVN